MTLGVIELGLEGLTGAEERNGQNLIPRDQVLKKVQGSSQVVEPLKCFSVLFQKWDVDDKTLVPEIASHTIQEAFEVVENILHVSQNDYACTCGNQSIPALPKATGEEEEEDEAPCMFGAAQKDACGHPGYKEDKNGGYEFIAGYSQEACRKASNQTAGSQVFDEIQPPKASGRHICSPEMKEEAIA